MANQDIYQSITDRIIDALDKNIIPWRKPWTGGGKNAPRNALTNRPYRGMNTWLLSLEAAFRGFDDNRWLTFNQARQAGGSVKKGAKSAEVILWKPMVKAKLDANGAPVIKNGKPVMTQFLFLRTFRVFNVEETENVKLPKVKEVSGTDITPIEEAEKIMTGYLEQNPIPMKFGFDHACYYPGADYIEMPDMKQFKKADEYYATMFHEFTHSTGHKTRCNREGIDTFDHFGSEKYAKEELVAEMGASMLCAIAGIDSTIDNSVAYIQNWKAKLQDDPKLIIGAAAQAQKAADYVLGIEVKKEEANDDV